LLLPLSHQVAHHHHHGDVIICLLGWYLLLQHGVLTYGSSDLCLATEHGSLNDSAFLYFPFHHHITAIEFFTHELFCHRDELLSLLNCRTDGRILTEKVWINSRRVCENLFPFGEGSETMVLRGALIISLRIAAFSWTPLHILGM